MSPSVRKLAAILFTDVVGYTTLVSRDERHAAGVRERHRHLVQTLVTQFKGEWIIASLIPGASLVTVEGRNHAFSAFEPAYKQVNQAIDEFFDHDLPAARRANAP